MFHGLLKLLQYLLLLLISNSRRPANNGQELLACSRRSPESEPKYLYCTTASRLKAIYVMLVTKITSYDEETYCSYLVYPHEIWLILYQAQI